MNYYDIKNYTLYGFIGQYFNKRILILFVISIALLFIFRQKTHFFAGILVFGTFGCIFDLATHHIIGNIWASKSLRDVKHTNEKLLRDLRKVSWQPRIVGILERIIFTTGFVMGRFEFIGGWLALKVIGGWKSHSTTEKSELWRIRENIFLIGTALSLILSFCAAFLYFHITDQSNDFLYRQSLQNQENIAHPQSHKNFHYHPKQIEWKK